MQKIGRMEKIKAAVTLPLAAMILVLFVGATTLQYTSFMRLEGCADVFNRCRKAALILACAKIALYGCCDLLDLEETSLLRKIGNAFKQNIVFVLLLCLSVMVSHYAGKKDLFFLIIILASLRGVHFSFILKWYLLIQIVLMAVTVQAAVQGVIPNMEVVRNETKMRYGMGYDYPSVTMTFLFFIVMAYAWLKRAHAFWLPIAVFFVVTIWLFQKTDARMGLLAILVVFLSMGIDRGLAHWNKKKSKKSLHKNVFCSIIGGMGAVVNDTLPFWMIGFMIFASAKYPNAAWTELADNILTKRVQYSAAALENYGIPLFGQVIQWVGYGGENAGKLAEGLEYNFVDCSYLQMLVQYGLVWTLVILTSLSALLHKLRKEKAWYSLFLVWMVVGYCFVEPRLLEVHANIFLCLLVPFLFRWDKQRQMWDACQCVRLPEKYLVVEQRANENHAGAKARNDIAQILLSHEWTPLRVTKGDGKGMADKLRMCVVVVFDWTRLLFDSDFGVPILVQYPLATYPMVRFLALPFLALLKYVKRNPIYYLIHDIESMRLNTTKEQRGEMRFFALANGMISHNAKMTEYLHSMGVKCPITEIEVFDYLTDIPLPEEKRFLTCSVAVAGNLNRKKAGYLYEMEKQNSAVVWQVYGPNFEGTKGGCLDYRGQFPAEELPAQFEASFGLVWDGDSCATCSGLYGAYLRFNNPHKLSLYLASGMPVIVWKESALADWVEVHQVGFAVDSLYELEKRIHQITPEQYARWQTNVYALAQDLRGGAHTLKAANQVVQWSLG